MSKPLVSLIVPVYNVERYLPKALDSAINQTYQNMEFIVIDDGSTDESGKICDCFQENDDRIKVIHKKNGGLSSARNAGLDIARGEFIAFLDSDDWLPIDAIQREIAIITKYNTRMVAFKIGYSHDGQTFPKYSDTWRETIQMNQEEMILAYLTRKPVAIEATVWSKIYHRSVWEKRRFREGILYEDYDLIMEILQDVKECIYLNQFGYVQLSREGSITHRVFDEQDMVILDIIQRMQVAAEQDFKGCDKICAWIALKNAAECRNLIDKIENSGKIEQYKKQYMEILECFGYYIGIVYNSWRYYPREAVKLCKRYRSIIKRIDK